MRSSPLVVAVAAFHSSGRTLAAMPAAHKLNWKKDVVYLYQFPRSPVVPNLSPYCLKVETFLRIKQIKHEIVETYTKKSGNGLLPFIELNGEHIPDSQIIIQRLQKHYGVEDNLSPPDRGVARAIDRMLDGSTLHALQQDRLVKNPHQFASRAVSGIPLPAFITNRIGERLAKIMGSRMRRNLGGFTPDQIKEVLRRDLEAIDDVIGEKRFLFGEVPTATDCSVFGHIASSYYLPYRQAVSDYIDDDFGHLKAFLFRMRAHYYPEWKDE